MQGVPTLDDVDNLEQENTALLAKLNKLAAINNKLCRNLKAAEEANKSHGFRLEQQRLVQISVWFYILIVPTIFCTFGSWTKGSYLWTTLNGIGFLLVWRSLYARHNKIWFIVAGIIVGLTIKYV